MKSLFAMLAMSVIAVSTTACKAVTTPGTADGTVTSVTTPPTPPQQSGNQNATPTPTPIGMNCTGYNGADNIEAHPVFFVDSIPGTEITSMSLNVYFSNDSGPMTGNTTYETTMTITAYGCGSANNLGAQLGVATFTGGVGGQDSPKLFTFSSPITIPTNCSVGEAPLVFEWASNGGVNGYIFYADSGGTSSSCFLQESSNNSGTGSSGSEYRSWTSVINAQ